MAKKLDLIGGGNDTLIGSGVKVKGNLRSEGDITIDGTLVGDIKAAGSVSIGVNGIVKADINAASVIVAGHLDGNISAETETTITETGRVNGDITTPIVAISAGAIFIGRVIMTQTETEVLGSDNFDDESVSKSSA